jgi:hypothetical protein
MGLGSGIRGPEFGILKKPIPDPGSRGKKGTGSRTRNTVFFPQIFPLRYNYLSSKPSVP